MKAVVYKTQDEVGLEQVPDSKIQASGDKSKAARH